MHPALDKLRSRFTYYAELLESLEHALKDHSSSLLPQLHSSTLDLIYNQQGTCFRISIGDARCISISQIQTSSQVQDTEDSIMFTLDSEMDEGVDNEVKILSINRGVDISTESSDSYLLEDPNFLEEPAAVPQPSCKLFKLGTKSDYEEM